MEIKTTNEQQMIYVCSIGDIIGEFTFKQWFKEFDFITKIKNLCNFSLKI